MFLLKLLLRGAWQVRAVLKGFFRQELILQRHYLVPQCRVVWWHWPFAGWGAKVNKSVVVDEYSLCETRQDQYCPYACIWYRASPCNPPSVKQKGFFGAGFVRGIKASPPVVRRVLCEPTKRREPDPRPRHNCKEKGERGCTTALSCPWGAAPQT